MSNNNNLKSYFAEGTFQLNGDTFLINGQVSAGSQRQAEYFVAQEIKSKLGLGVYIDVNFTSCCTMDSTMNALRNSTAHGIKIFKMIRINGKLDLIEVDKNNYHDNAFMG